MEIEYLRRIVNRKYAQVIYLIGEGGGGSMGFNKYSHLILSLIVYYFKNMRKNIKYIKLLKSDKAMDIMSVE